MLKSPDSENLYGMFVTQADGTVIDEELYEYGSARYVTESIVSSGHVDDDTVLRIAEDYLLKLTRNRHEEGNVGRDGAEDTN